MAWRCGKALASIHRPPHRFPCRRMAGCWRLPSLCALRPRQGQATGSASVPRRVAARRMSAAPSSSSSGGAAAAAVSAAPPQAGARPSAAQSVDFLTLLQHLKVGQGQLGYRAACGQGGAGAELAGLLPAPTPRALPPPPPFTLVQTQKRTGWVKRGVQGPESIADHMYRMGLMAMLVQGTEYDYHRWVRAAGGCCWCWLWWPGGLIGGRRGFFACGCWSAWLPSTCWMPSSIDCAFPPAPLPMLPVLPACRCMKLALVHDVAEAIVGDITPTCGVSDADKHALESAAVQRIKAMLGGTTLAGEEIEQLWLEYEAGQTAEAQLVKDFDKVGAAWWVLPGGCCLVGAAWWVLPGGCCLVGAVEAQGWQDSERQAGGGATHALQQSSLALGSALVFRAADHRGNHTRHTPALPAPPRPPAPAAGDDPAGARV